jgi:hypothetical protein
MLRVICPIDGTVHQADESHAGKMLRCAKCGRPVQIGSPSEGSKAKLANTAQGIGRRGKLTLFVAGLAMGCIALLVFHFHLRGETEDAARSRMPASERSAAYQPPDAVPGSSMQQMEPELHRTLGTGTRIRPDSEADGIGKLTIDNTDGEDSEVKVISTSDGRVVKDVFVQGQTKIACEKLRSGAYMVLFAAGEDWNPSTKHFTRHRSFFQFGKSLAFNETQLKDGIEYSHHEITLYTLPGGNVTPEVITESLFDSK